MIKKITSLPIFPGLRISIETNALRYFDAVFLKQSYSLQENLYYNKPDKISVQ